MGRYTIGFLGHFAYAKRICDYMDTLLLRALEQHSEVRVMLTLWRETDRLMAGRVLEIGNLFPGLRMVPVITEQEERIYKKNSPSLSARERKRRLDAAGGYEVVPDILSSNKLPGYHQKFIECCDQIVYSTFQVPVYIREDFARKVRMQKSKQPLVHYVMQGGSLPGPVSMEPMIELQQSVEYVRRSGFRILTDILPQELLEKWLANADLPKNYMEFGTLEDAVEVFHRKSTSQARYLLFKIFTFAYIVSGRLLTQPDDTACGKVSARFRQFRRILRLLAGARAAGIEVGRYDLLDFDAYDDIMRRYEWIARLDDKAAQCSNTETFFTDGKTE